MSVIIGVDPHKATHTAVAIDRTEAVLSQAKVRARRRQVQQLLAGAEPLGGRTWAIDSAAGLGCLLAQQLVSAGETVVDVPATLAARIRVIGTGRSDRNDPNGPIRFGLPRATPPPMSTKTEGEPSLAVRGPSRCSVGGPLTPAKERCYRVRVIGVGATWTCCRPVSPST
jgi:Transposase